MDSSVWSVMSGLRLAKSQIIDNWHVTYEGGPMFYEIINPSDKMTVEADSDLVAALAGLNLGEGKIGIDNEKGEGVLPIFLLGGDAALLEWLKTVGIDSLDGLRPACIEHKDEIAACLESIVYGGFSDRKGIMAVVEGQEHHEKLVAMEKWNDAQRSSLNDYSKAAFKLAKAIRELTADEEESSEGEA